MLDIDDEEKGRIKFLNNDNDEARAFTESCFRKKKTILNPIINWSDEDVWEFIRKYDVPYCKLYDEGFTRLGCIGCPMNRHREDAFRRYPKYKQMYLKAFARMEKERERKGLKLYGGADAVMDWWLDDNSKPDSIIEGQIEMVLEDL